MYRRVALAFAVASLAPVAARAQNVSEDGWTALYTQTTGGNTGTVATGENGIIFWGPIDGAIQDYNESNPGTTGRRPIRMRTPTGPGTGRVKTLHHSAKVRGLALHGGYLYHTTEAFSIGYIQRFIPGQVSASWVSSFDVGYSTTIRGGSGGSNNQALPQANIQVVSTTNFVMPNTISVVTTAGTQLVHCTNKDQDTFTGCSGGSGTMATGNAVKSNNDAPGGIEIVHAQWAGGAIVSAGELLVPESGDHDVLYAVATNGTVRTVGNDPSTGNQRFVDVAIGRHHILVADTVGDAIYTVDPSSGGMSPISGVTLPVNPVGIEWDSGLTGNDSFIVAFDDGTLYRITAAAASNGTAFSSAQIGSGFTFNASATQVLDMSDDGRILAIAGNAAISAFARCALASGENCDGGGVADLCRVLVDGLSDCNNNLRPDACDVDETPPLGDGSYDCDGNDVPDECAACSVPVEMVFAVDTSGSMGDEAATLCSNLAAIISTLEGEGITVHATIYAISTDQADYYNCEDGILGTALGTDLPGSQSNDSAGRNQDTLYSGCSDSSDHGPREDWGRGVSVIAGHYPWGVNDSTPTTIAVNSNNFNLPQPTIHVASTTDFPPSAITIKIATDQGRQTVTCRGKATGMFTDCSGGSGTLKTGAQVTQVNASIPLVVVVSDEGPWCGSGVNVSDETSIDNAVQIASDRNVRASVVLASGYYNNASPANGGPPLMEALAVELANGTGGTVTRDFSGAELVEAMKSVVRDVCVDEADCDNNGIPDTCELAEKDCNHNGRLDVCEGVVCTPSTTHLTAVGQPNVSYDVVGGFGGSVSSVTILGVSGGPNTAGAAYNAGVITFTPDFPAQPTDEAAPYVVTYRLCDTSPSPRCGVATMTIFYNDPPTLAAPTRTVLFGSGTTTVAWQDVFTNTGVYHGDAADGDTDGVVTTLVSATADGDFDVGPILLGDASSFCEIVDLTGDGPADIRFTAPDTGTAHDVTCYVQVCEELPLTDFGATDTRVCRVTPVTFALKQCTQNAHCDQSDDACDAPDTCNAAGNCVDKKDAPGSFCGSANDDQCDDRDTCDGTTNTCHPNHVAVGTPCGDAPAADNCFLQDTCNGYGVCSDGGVKPEGAACGDPTASECSAPDTCDGTTGVCHANHASTATSCGDTESADNCFVQDKCSGTGTCVDNGYKAPATPCGDQSSDACSAPNSCDGTSGICQANHLPAGAHCGDTESADNCFVQDTCDGSGTCTDKGFKAPNTACGDSTGTECSAPDTCPGDSGVCQPNHRPTGTHCGDTAAADNCFNQDTCNGYGVCADAGVKNEGDPCGDPTASECTAPDSCDGTTGACHANHTAADTPCGDAETDDNCFVQDRCSGTGTCVDKGFKPAATLCGDRSDSECTNPDTCDGSSGVCHSNHETLGTPCGDTATADNCFVQDTCNSYGACADNGFKSLGAACGDRSDTECSNPDTCPGDSGVCQPNHEPSTTSCGDTESADNCFVQDKCSGTGTCDDKGFKPAATPCGDASDTECSNPDTCTGTSGVCQPNHEPSTTSCGDTESPDNCFVQDKCSGTGTCDDKGFKPAATPCGDDSDTECTNPDSCNGTSGTCQPNHAPVDTNCGDAEAACVNQDKCNGYGGCENRGFKSISTPCTGASQGAECDNDAADHCSGDSPACVDVFDPAGAVCGNRADSTCDRPDSCSGTDATCRPNFAPSGAGCGDSADNACTDPDTCDGTGTCKPNHAPSGAGCGDSADTDCTDPDTCDGGGTCKSNHALQGASCGDTSATACSDPDTCDGGGTCLGNHAGAGTLCDDGNACTTTDACDASGACAGSGAPNADDGDPCTDDACDPASGITHTPNTGAACNDNNACTTLDTCNAGACVGGGSPSDLDDRDVCTLDACNPATGAVSHTKTDPDCCSSDGECDSGEICDEPRNKCALCVDSRAFPLTDDGCGLANPVCNTATTPAKCVTCVNSKPSDNETDDGCRASARICDESVPGGTCIECNDNADCGAGRVCDTSAGLCVTCLDDKRTGSVDSGCSAALPICELALPGIADDHCVECVDDKGAGLIDWGCEAGTPYCKVVTPSGPDCIECESDTDCPGEEVCVVGACVDNGATVAVDDAYTTREGQALTVADPTRGLAGNDRWPTGTTVTVRVVPDTAPSPANQGTLAVAPDGTFTFAPVAGYAATLTFTYTLTNTDSGATDDAVVTLLVDGPPRAQNDVLATDEHVPATVDVRANDNDPNGGPITLTRIVTAPTHGTATIVNGAIRYAPDTGYSGSDTLTYEVCDASNLCSTASVAITVRPVNDRPTPFDDLVETPEDQAVLVVVLGNDRDAEGAPLDVKRIVTPATHGTATLQPDDAVQYVPARDFNGADTFVYEACDDGGLCAEGVVLVTVTPVNDAPTAGDDATTTPAGTPVTLVVTTNDSDVDGDTLKISRLVFPPASGTATIVGTDRITYAPGQSAAGLATFSYEVCDAELCDVAQVRITVGSNNTPPAVGDDDVATSAGIPVTIDVLANDRDADADSLTITQVGTPTSGTATLGADGRVTYTPAPGFTGTASISYTACDGAGACESAIVTVDIAPTSNRPPVAVDDLVATRKNTPVDVDPTLNDVDPDGDAIAVESLAIPPRNGTARLEADGSFTYTPAPGFVGDDSFDVTVTDGQGGFDTSTVNVRVEDVANTPPRAADDGFDVPADRPTELDVLANDGDTDGDTLAIIGVVQPRQGSAALVGTGAGQRIVYAPGPDARGSDAFAYTISDGRGGTARGTVTLTFPVVNSAPEATGDQANTDEDAGVLVLVLANDVDPDSDPLTLSAITTPPRMGTATIEGQAVRYQPAADRSGSDVFGYRVCDPDGLCDTATAAVVIAPVNDAPRAGDDAYSVPADAPSTLEVLLNDSDPELDALTVTRLLSQPRSGYVSLLPGGAVRYQPAGTTGSYSFRYEVCDTHATCDQALVSIFVGTGNRNPLPEDDRAETTFGEPVGIDVLANDADPDDDLLTIAFVEDPRGGEALIFDGEVTYTPDFAFHGIDTFFYTVCDPSQACSSAFIEVEVAPGANTPPTAVDDTIHTAMDTAVTFRTTDNDVDFDGDPLTVTAVGSPSHGVATLEASGAIRYTPPTRFTGQDTFTVTISDGRGGDSTQDVWVIVLPAANRPPVAGDDTFVVPGEGATTLRVLDNDVDPDGDALTIIGVSQLAHSALAIAADGTLVLTPTSAEVGRRALTYTVSDGKGGIASARVTLDIGDRDGDGLGDRHEIEVTKTDPDKADTDGDGLSDGLEVADGLDPMRYEPGVDLDPLDADTDDDGLSDGTELRGDGPLEAPTNPLDADTDGDGISDGVEAGVTTPVAGGDGFAGTDTSRWIADADPNTTTDPLDDDSDDDGLLDGTEDGNANGRVDGQIGGTGSEGSGETDAGVADSDGDGVQDGTELGLTTPQGHGTDLDVFQPDADPSTRSDPRDSDFDDDGLSDGAEDLNGNGAFDPGESDPTVTVDAPIDEPTPTKKSGGCTSSHTGGLVALALGTLALLSRRRRRSR